MPKFSKIVNRTTTCISIDREKLKKAKENQINLSLLLDEALEREFNPKAEKFFNKAIENQNKQYKNYIQESEQIDDFDKYKFKEPENVVEKIPSAQENRKDKGSIAGI